ncbi:MAG: type II secretion system F family protein [Phycisphaerae bacterium]
MPTFAYKAMDSSGQRTAGSVPAASRAAALDHLAQMGLIPVTVNEVAGPVAAKPVVHTGGRVPHGAAEAFVRELSNLLAGGVPLSKALHILSRETSHAATKAQWTAIHDDVVGGQTLAEAMSRWPKSFSPVQIAMVRAGETGGFLDVVLAQIAEFRARERDLKSKIKGALVYPAVLAVLSTVVVIFLMTFFIPRFKNIFIEIKGTLPLLTNIIIGISGFVTHYGLAILIALVVLAVLARRGLKSEAGKRYKERFLLRVPALGAVVSRFALVRFSRMLGTLLGAGVPLVSALKVAREAIGNQTLADAMAVSIEEVQRGASLARSLAACPLLFPTSTTEVIAVAEESARLDKELLRLATANEAELDRRLRMLVALAEPAMLFLMAAIVGTIVIGMLLPVFTLQDYIH